MLSYQEDFSYYQFNILSRAIEKLYNTQRIIYHENGIIRISFKIIWFAFLTIEISFGNDVLNNL